ncbi:MAG: porin [Hyphomicrobiaceae bacterium]|nr:porin [Hyphomicrobiaceae bacterium]
MKNISLSALLATGLLAGGLATGASAADLGGDCCADLEERVAELEATTARKGNRKVSLTVSGFVAQQVLIWDDGQESNVYITDTGSVSIGTHIAFSGKAQINSDVEAGFVLKLETMNNDSLGVNQDNDEGGNVYAALQGGGLVAVESAYWYLKSNHYGRFSVGQQSSAADNQAIIVDGSGSLVQANYVLYDVQGFFVNRNGARTALTWGQLANCHPVTVAVAADCDGYPSNVIRYDTPTFGGFAASASWGEDDVWAVSGRYAGSFGDVKVAAAIAYVQSTDEGAPNASGLNGAALGNGGLDASHLQVGAFVMHSPTGLFLYGAYGYEDPEVTASLRGAGRANPDGENYYIKAGLRRQFFPIGHSVLYGEYGRNDDKIFSAAFDAGISSSELDQYGIGFVQEIDAAAMSIWLSWRHYEADVTCNGAGCAGAGLGQGNNGLDDMDIVKFGALINF